MTSPERICVQAKPLPLITAPCPWYLVTSYHPSGGRAKAWWQNRVLCPETSEMGLSVLDGSGMQCLSRPRRGRVEPTSRLASRLASRLVAAFEADSIQTTHNAASCI